MPPSRMKCITILSMTLGFGPFQASACKVFWLYEANDLNAAKEHFGASQEAFDEVVKNTHAAGQLERNCGRAKFSLLLPSEGQTRWFDPSKPSRLVDPLFTSSLNFLSDIVNKITVHRPAQSVFLIGYETSAAMAIHFARLYPMRLGGIMAVNPHPPLDKDSMSVKVTDTKLSTPTMSYSRTAKPRPRRSGDALDGIRYGTDLLTDLLLLMTRPLCGVIWVLPDAYETSKGPLGNYTVKLSVVVDHIIGLGHGKAKSDLIDSSEFSQQCGQGVTYRVAQLPSLDLKLMENGEVPSNTCELWYEIIAQFFEHRVNPEHVVIGGAYGAENAIEQCIYTKIGELGKIGGLIKVIDRNADYTTRRFHTRQELPTETFKLQAKSQALREELAATLIKFLTAPPRQCSAILVVSDAFEAKKLDSWGDDAREIARTKRLMLDPLCNGRVEFVTITLSMVKTIGQLRRAIQEYSPPNLTFIFFRSSDEYRSIEHRSVLRSHGYHVIPLATMKSDGDLASAMRAHLALVANSVAAAIWTR